MNAMTECNHHNQCIADAVAEAKSRCEQQHVRFTEQRQRVFELVWASHQPIKAYDILAALQKDDPAAKPPTVYRALDFLLELGLIHKLHRLNAYTGCAHIEANTPCLFLICAKCGEVSEEDSPSLSNFIDKTAKAHHFQPGEAALEIEGLCARCA
ncbi:MAG: Fur family transcriptional regulator [Rickettsiales bacterium]|nr:Fur family transcriptional regulator [Rickettsiales bacterium]|tara:strand:+ start:689 stop:1153 length:465 start_codon:yes stop_codon:yes gene_type:complete